MIEIRNFILKDVEDVCHLFNDQKLIYHPWDRTYFMKKFLENPYFCSDCTFIVTHLDQVIGYGSGLYKKVIVQNEVKSIGYVTMVVVSSNYRRKKIGSQLLEKIEAVLNKKGVSRIDCSFFNPINLNWMIPNTNKHEHPNAPGVVYPSDAYHFFLNHGYHAVAKENAYYLKLSEFELPSAIKEKVEDLKEQGITFEYFDQTKHHYGDLFDRLGNEAWKEEITKASVEKKLPVLTPIYQNEAIGFTGPLYVEENGRGYFTGIGVHPNYRSNGVGKILFFLLCYHLKQLGAIYMSLFTGEENKARRMYENANFKIVKSFYVMRKEKNNG